MNNDKTKTAEEINHNLDMIHGAPCCTECGGTKILNEECSAWKRKRPTPSQEKMALEFAEWILESDYMQMGREKFWFCANELHPHNAYKTTAELYKEYEKSLSTPSPSTENKNQQL